MTKRVQSDLTRQWRCSFFQGQEKRQFQVSFSSCQIAGGFIQIKKGFSICLQHGSGRKCHYIKIFSHGEKSLILLIFQSLGMLTSQFLVVSCLFSTLVPLNMKGEGLHVLKQTRTKNTIFRQKSPFLSPAYLLKRDFFDDKCMFCWQTNVSIARKS